jgi:penicillin-binding protein 1A
MNSMLKKTLENGPNGWGTLYNPSGWGSKFTFQDANGNRFRMPMAGKTGTPQNWSDAWTIGYSAYYTTAIWFGFDKPGNSLGVNLTGSTLAGPVWADYMREIHQGLPLRDFVRPSTGVVDVTVCAKSGLLRTGSCNEGEVTLTFLQGTQPVQACAIHGNSGNKPTIIATVYVPDTLLIDDSALIARLRMPTLSADILNPPSRIGSTSTIAPQAYSSIVEETSTESKNLDGLPSTQDIFGINEYPTEVPPYGLEIPSYNPFME